MTQLDKLKIRPNVLVMTTSNIAGAIGQSPYASPLTCADSAFVDRADIKEYVGLPPPQAVYWILTSCLNELIDKKLVRPCEFVNWRNFDDDSMDKGRESRASLKLKRLAETCSVCISTAQ